MSALIFKDLKVVELASVLAGPAVGMFFAELGARVIKIENKKTGGDVTRTWRLPSESAEAPVSAYYCSVNWGKQSLLLDLEAPEDRQTAQNLILEADVLISNFKPSFAQKTGLDFETLRRDNPRLIYAQLLAFEHDDTIPAFDIVLQAEAGFLYMTGEADRPPSRMPVALIDLLAAHQLKEGILIALLQRERSGEGSFVQTSLMASALASLANQATNWLMAGHIPQRMGSSHPNIAPYGDIFHTADGKALVLAIGADHQFRNLCKCLDLCHLPEDERFSTNPNRVKNRQALVEALKPAFLQFQHEVLISTLHKNGVPAGSVRNMEEVFELPFAQSMVLEETLADGSMSKRVKTVAFTIKINT
ncbi:MAG: CoA transferase [Saprospiraceae bacterium]|nr:CoA transferase [Saprospiraceae bacterium]MDZ4702994.1 CoA transferase [Saprospiraceae bacterium]